MNSQTRNAYEGLSREDWVKLGYLHKDVPLTRNFHPIFQRTNASRPALAEHIWPQFKEEDQYQRLCAVMGNVFQLASNILESPESLDFLYQVAYSPRRVADKGLSNKGRPCKEFGWIEPPSKGYARQMARDALRRLSNSLSFTIGDPAANPALGHAVAVTGFVLEGFEDGVKINDASGQSGMASRITINQEFLVMLTELETQEEDTTWQKMSMELKLAITLCHEIGHVLAFAVNGELLQGIHREFENAKQARREGRYYELQAVVSDEPFYRDERMAEIGNSWENHVFGGKVIWSERNTSEPLFVSKWPSFLTSDDDYPKRGKEKQTARKYFVSRHFVQNMHRQGFWDNVKPEHLKALHIKKTIAIELLNPDEEATSIDSSQINYPIEESSSRVSRERDGQSVPDPSPAHANETAEEGRAR